MFRVRTDDSWQRNKLQEEYALQKNYYTVPLKENHTLVQIIKAICFQFFKNDLPPLAQRIQRIILNLINMNCELTSFRELMDLIKNQQQTLQNYRSYFDQMNLILSEQSQQLPNQPFRQRIQSDDIFDECLKRESLCIENLQSMCLPLQMININESQKYRESDQTTQETRRSKQKFDTNNKLFNFFNSSNLFFKEQSSNKCSREDSAQLTSFSIAKSPSVFDSNKTLTTLVLCQTKQDLQKESQIAKNKPRHQQVQPNKYNKLIKEAKFNSKIKLRSRKR